MSDFQKLPEEDFMYDKVDFHFLVELNMLVHFIKLSHGRIEGKKGNHIICETFIVLKNLIDKHLPSLSHKIVSTEQSQKDLDDIFKRNRKAMEAAVEKEVQKELGVKK